MKYNGFTNVGSMYQAKCKANELPIKFVKVKVGNGLLEETEDPAKFIDVKSLKKEVVISEKTQIEDAVRLTIQMDNDGVTEGYFPREFGIYVEDEGVEVLYWYVNDGNEASYLPSQSTAPVKLKNHFNIIATTLESLVVNWSGKEFWVDKEYLEKKMEVNGNLTTDKINGLAGGYNGTFPLISAIKDNIYLLPATNKFYVCIENYSGSSLTVPNANFEELSVFQNRNKLENLSKIYEDDKKYFNGETIPKWQDYKFHYIRFCISTRKDTTTDVQITISGTDRLQFNDNYLKSGSYSSSVDNSGTFSGSGTSSYVQNSWVTNIRMWN